MSKERYGTLFYTSPEIVLGYPHNTMTDIWSFGVLIYYLLSGEFPFNDITQNKNTIGHKIVKSEVEFPSFKWEYRSKEVKELIRQCLEKDMDKRPSAGEILDAEWFTKYQFNLVKKAYSSQR